MTAITIDAGAKRTSHAVLVALLAAAIFINYVDRGNLATASPLLKGELKLSNAQLGLLASAFFWVYAPGQLLAAWLVQRINAYRALTVGLGLWSLATMLSGLAGGFATLLGLRVLLGLGESVGFPASSKLLAQHLPQHRLGTANAVILGGLSLGPAIGTFFGGLLIAHTGWRALFVIFGAVSLLWLAPWLMATRSLAAEARAAPQIREPSYRELLSKRELWGAASGHFCGNYAFYLVLTWLPLYLVKVHGYSLAEMGVLTGAVYALSVLVGVSAGMLADRLVARGVDVTLVRKGMICSGAVAGLICMLACALGEPRVAIGGLVGFSVFHGLSGFNTFAIGQTLAGPSAAAKWMGVQNGVANLSGIIGPVLTGLIVDWTGSFRIGFLVAAGVLVVGFVSWGVVIRRIEPLRWSSLDRV